MNDLKTINVFPRGQVVNQISSKSTSRSRAYQNTLSIGQQLRLIKQSIKSMSSTYGEQFRYRNVLKVYNEQLLLLKERKIDEKEFIKSVKSFLNIPERSFISLEIVNKPRVEEIGLNDENSFLNGNCEDLSINDIIELVKKGDKRD